MTIKNVFPTVRNSCDHRVEMVGMVADTKVTPKMKPEQAVKRCYCWALVTHTYNPNYL
jgi:hypothetical protein